VDVHLARLDLGQVEDVEMSAEQVRAGLVDRPRELDLLVGEVAVGLSASSLERMSSELSGVRSSWLMFARNSLLYFEVSASSCACSSSDWRASSISRFCSSMSRFCWLSSAAFSCSSSLVWRSSSCWVCSSSSTP
jgi:hypothetical protein